MYNIIVIDNTGRGQKMDLLTPDEVAELLKVKRTTIMNWLRDGKLPGIKLGDGKAAEWRVERSDLEAYLQSRKTGM
jgi:excisionase family DNA binding protein